MDLPGLSMTSLTRQRLVETTLEMIRLRDLPAVTGVSTTKIKREIREGRLVARKLGRCTVVLSDDIKRWQQALPIREVAGVRGK